MKILKIINEKEFNIENYNALNLAISLKKKGDEVILLCPEKSQISKEAKKNKIETLSFGLLESIGFAKLPKVDIIDIYSYFPTLPLVLKNLSKKNIPIFYHQISFPTKSEIKRLFDIQFMFSRILVSCQSIYDEMIFSGLSADKLFILPPALNITRWESAKLIKYAMFLKRPFRVGISYRVINYQELEIFLKTAQLVIKEEPDTNFMIVGPKYEKIRELARAMGISHKIDMLDWRTDMPEIMAMMHIYVKVKTSPVISRGLIEAMASGVACIIPEIQGLTDFISHDYSGLVVKDGTPQEYSKAILLLIKNPPLCQALSSMAYHYINNNLSLPVITNLLKVIYEEGILFYK